MAVSVQSLHIYSCSVCLEDFTNSGDNVPRLLPCTHTYCEKCIKDLLQQDGGNTLKCPECRLLHPAPYELRSFPQNKYLLSSIKRRIRPEVAVAQNQLKQCPEHGKELTLYCKQCQNTICLVCLKTRHKGHDFVEIEDAERNLLIGITFRKS